MAFFDEAWATTKVVGRLAWDRIKTLGNLPFIFYASSATGSSSTPTPPPS